MRASNVGTKLNRLACYLTNRRSKEKDRSITRGITGTARVRVRDELIALDAIEVKALKQIGLGHDGVGVRAYRHGAMDES